MSPRMRLSVVLVGILLIRLGESQFSLAAQGSPTPAASDRSFPGQISDYRGYQRHDLTVDGCPTIIVTPRHAVAGKPWIWRAEFFDAFPQIDLALLARGFHLVYITVGNTFGCPDALAHWDVLYKEMTQKHDLSRKPVLEGLSRGGLYCFNWAANNPDKVGCILADNAVLDFKSWPGGKGKGKGSPRDWKKLQQDYHFKSEAEALAYKKNPVDNLEPLARAKVPLFLLCGDADDVVPYEENGAIVQERYRKLGGPVQVLIKKGMGHHPHGLDEPTPVVEFILKQLAVSSPSASDRNNVLKLYDFDEYGKRPVSFYYCQAGFHPDGYKPVYVWTREEYSHGSATLRNCATGKTVPVPLVCAGINIWGRQDWIADCTDTTVEGDYILRVEFGRQTAETEPFAISKSCYEQLREKAAKHYFLKRCGIFCHEHDGNLYSLETGSFGKVLRHLSAHGGWHDAHDDNKWVPFVWAAVYGLLRTEERFRPRWPASHEPYPYCLAEAWWEVDWLLRMQKNDGTYYFGVAEWFPKKQKDRIILQVHHADQNYDDLHADRRAVLDVWGENAICDLLGRPHNTFPSTAPKYFAYCAHILRYCGRLMRCHDEKNMQRCLRAAQQTLAYLEHLKTYPAYQELEIHAALALYYLEEARDGGGNAALRQAEGHLQKMLALQQPAGHFHSSQKCRGLEFYPEEAGDERVFVDYPFGYMLAFIEYLEYARRDQGKTCLLVDEIKKAYVRFVQLLKKFSGATVFRQPGEIRFDRKPMVIIPPDIAAHGYNPYILSAGLLFAAAEHLAGYPGGQKLGERQLHFILGANPRFMSFMNQVGVRNAGQYAAASSVSRQYYPMAFYRHLRDMRWGVTTGLFGPLAKDAGDGSGRRPVYVQPLHYPNAGNAAAGTYNSTAQETWLNCNGWLLLLLAQLGQ